jgi:RNase P protein component
MWPRLVPQWDLVISARATAGTARGTDLAEELESLLGRAKVLTTRSKVAGI